MKFYGELFLENEEDEGAFLQVHVAAEKSLLKKAVTKDRLFTLGYAEGQLFKEVLGGMARDFVQRIGASNIHCKENLPIFVSGLFPRDEFPMFPKNELSCPQVVRTDDLDGRDLEYPAWYRNAVRAMQLKRNCRYVCKLGKLTVSFAVI